MKSPITLLAGVILVLGGSALGVSGVIQLLGPQNFQASTKIVVAKPTSTGGYDPLFVKAEADRIQSPAVITNVIGDLNLNDLWGKKYNRGQRLSDLDVERLLKVDCRTVRNTDLIEIMVRSEDPGEAAALANAIARNYRVHAAQAKWASVNVVMSATVPPGAVSPNRPLAIVLIGAGIIMAVGGIFCFSESASGSEV